MQASGFVVGFGINDLLEDLKSLVGLVQIEINKAEVVGDFSVGGSEGLGLFEDEAGLLKILGIDSREADKDSGLGFIEVEVVGIEGKGEGGVFGGEIGKAGGKGLVFLGGVKLGGFGVDVSEVIGVGGFIGKERDGGLIVG